MVGRPTIRDLADAAGVSVSTVNRVINQPDSVRQPTRDRVLYAAEDIGFYGLGSIENSVMRARETHRLGVLLQQGDRAFYSGLGKALTRAAQTYHAANIDLQVEYLSDLSPENVAARIRALGTQADSIGVVAAEHPYVSDAIDTVIQHGVPVTALIAVLSAQHDVGFVGLDGWKVGRTAAWAFHRMCREPGEVAILLGNPRYRNQELNETGFRSYFREHCPSFTLLEPRSTLESLAIAKELTHEILDSHPKLKGLFISGGGVTGVLEALRERPQADDFVTVGYELFGATRTGLIDGTLTMAICHPVEAFARQIISQLVAAKLGNLKSGATTTYLNFEIYTSENV
ncbi:MULTISPECIES: LacI family DNA-binding transcriptional regulator [Donghicola]|jgi:LacI family transcriptional regulator|uniref:HTH lacI-type domain-containing protein n=1 Tax=Donghicola eburneus TaxID=393278 RepID=A0A1M4MXG5_9RHOB|nr:MULTISPECIES: LacI family DNA-binding transcriptional regulator [Donghicola]MCT4579112.1 LacI family DNA-binding transcriptional regulator [Donghicola sp.]SCM66438.1 hypothetical protein KARMA_0613 [Donghicola eburneus]